MRDEKRLTPVAPDASQIAGPGKDTGSSQGVAPPNGAVKRLYAVWATTPEEACRVFLRRRDALVHARHMRDRRGGDHVVVKYGHPVVIPHDTQAATDAVDAVRGIR